jgi:hypothetical protein
MIHTLVKNESKTFLVYKSLVMLKSRPNRPGPASADLGLSGRGSVRPGLYRNRPKLGSKIGRKVVKSVKY